MFKILIADQDDEQNLQYYKFLSNENKYNVHISNNGYSTLVTYKKIKPNILILDSNFTDIKYTEIIDKLSFSPIEKRKCNIILTINQRQKTRELKNVIKINQILYKPIDYSELLEKINLMKYELELKNISENELNYYLLTLNFNINSKGCKYLKSAIIHYYYSSQSFDSLDHLFSTVATEYNINSNEVREGIRCSLIPLNTYRSNIKENPILKLFDDTRNITPKYFLDIFVTYLRIKKNKK